MTVIPLGKSAVYVQDQRVLITPQLADMPGADPTMGKLDPNATNQSNDIIYWGDGNNFPQMIKAAAYKNPIIPRAIVFHANMVAGATVLPVVKHFEEKRVIHEVVNDPVIWEYLDSIHFKRCMLESALDLYWFQNIFPEIIISKNRKSVSMVSPNEAMFCRWGVQNEKGISGELFHNANWPDATANPRDHKYTTIIPTIDPYAYMAEEAVRERSKEFKFAYPASYPSPGSVHYQTAFWDGIRQSKYLEYLTLIPDVKNQIIQNKIKPAFHVQIPHIHWERWFGSVWQDADHEKRKMLKAEYLDVLQNVLTAKTSAGAAFATEFGSSQVDQKVSEKWEITQIEDKTSEGTYIEDNIDGTVQLLTALALDPALLGYSSKESGTRNGGSDKTQSLLNYLITMKPFNDICLEPHRFKARFDGWTKKYPRFDFIATYPEIEDLMANGTPKYKNDQPQPEKPTK